MKAWMVYKCFWKAFAWRGSWTAECEGAAESWETAWRSPSTGQAKEGTCICLTRKDPILIILCTQLAAVYDQYHTNECSILWSYISGIIEQKSHNSYFVWCMLHVIEITEVYVYYCFLLFCAQTQIMIEQVEDLRKKVRKFIYCGCQLISLVGKNSYWACVISGLLIGRSVSLEISTSSSGLRLRF